MKDFPRNESEIIAQIQRFGRSSGGAAARIGIGDDCAVLHAPAAGCELLATTDQVIETKHFLRETHPAQAVGSKVITRGLSDIAAMGGRPTWFLLSLQLPDWTFGEWLEQFLQGMFDKIDELQLSNFQLVGGDLAAAESFSAHVSVTGEARSGEALLRSGASPGDGLWVSGQLGGSALGFDLLASGAKDGPALARHLYPHPRLELGEELRRRGATAAMDLSDGLSTDLARMAEASGVEARVDGHLLPLFDGASREQGLHGGEDYELLFCAPADFDSTGLDVTAIGEMRAGSGVWLTDEGRALDAKGFDHFR